jgi:hypothetical protein
LLIGNDVVDLGDDEAGLSNLHPRFVERVFAKEERGRIFSSPNPKVSLWTYWAAKESAYKIMKKVEGEVVFAPSTWVVELESEHGCGRLRGSVSDGRRLFDLEMMRTGEWIHALATLRSVPSEVVGILSDVERCPTCRDPSMAVRTLAVRALSEGLGFAAETLSIDRSKPPRVVGPVQARGVDLSLSHHGRWISFAATLPGEGLPRAAASVHDPARQIDTSIKRK